MVTLEKPDLLLVPLRVKLELAEVTTIGFVDDTLCEVSLQHATLLLHISRQKLLCR